MYKEIVYILLALTLSLLAADPSFTVISVTLFALTRLKNKYFYYSFFFYSSFLIILVLADLLFSVDWIFADQKNFYYQIQIYKGESLFDLANRIDGSLVVYLIGNINLFLKSLLSSSISFYGAIFINLGLSTHLINHLFNNYYNRINSTDFNPISWMLVCFNPIFLISGLTLGRDILVVYIIYLTIHSLRMIIDNKTIFISKLFSIAIICLLSYITEYTRIENLYLVHIIVAAYITMYIYFKTPSQIKLLSAGIFLLILLFLINSNALDFILKSNELISNQDEKYISLSKGSTSEDSIGKYFNWNNSWIGLVIKTVLWAFYPLPAWFGFRHLTNYHIVLSISTIGTSLYSIHLLTFLSDLLRKRRFISIDDKILFIIGLAFAYLVISTSNEVRHLYSYTFFFQVIFINREISNRVYRTWWYLYLALHFLYLCFLFYNLLH